MCVCRVVLLGK